MTKVQRSMATTAVPFRVLVATDGSSQAHAALATVATFPWPVQTRVQAVIARQGRGTPGIAASVRRALAQRWPDAEVVVVDMAPVDGILSEAQRFRADVIVVGWRGHGAVRRLLTGSVSRGVVRRAKCAVLVVRGRPPRVQKIVIGFDASAGAQLAVTLVGKLVAPRDGHVTLISAVQLMAPSSRGPVVGGIRASITGEVKRINTARVTEAKKALNRAGDELDRGGWRTRTVLRTGEPLRELIAAVSTAHPQMLVVGARGSSGVRHLLLGSVAEGVLNRLPIPVLVAR